MTFVPSPITIPRSMIAGRRALPLTLIPVALIEVLTVELPTSSPLDERKTFDPFCKTVLLDCIKPFTSAIDQPFCVAIELDVALPTNTCEESTMTFEPMPMPEVLEVMMPILKIVELAKALTLEFPMVMPTALSIMTIPPPRLIADALMMEVPTTTVLDVTFTAPLKFISELFTVTLTVELPIESLSVVTAVFAPTNIPELFATMKTCDELATVSELLARTPLRPTNGP